MLFQVGGESVELKDALRAARLQVNLTQGQLADFLSVSRRSVQAWEKGTQPKLYHRDRIQVFLDDPVGYKRRIRELERIAELSQLGLDPHSRRAVVAA